MSAAVDYVALLEQIKPEVAHTDETYQYLLERLSALMVRESLNEAENKLVELLTVLIREYEKARFPETEKARGIDVLRYLMEHQGLKSQDLVPSVFENESVVSEVLSGSRGFTVKHIRRLADRFHLSADVFID